MSRQRFIMALLAALGAWSTAAKATDPGGLFKRARWATIDIIGSRVAITELRLGQQSTVTCEDPENGSREILRLVARSAERSSLYYEYSGSGKHWCLEVDHGNRVQLRRSEEFDTSRLDLRYVQPASGPVRLTVDDGLQTREAEAASFWHLVLAEPELCRRRLVPSLQAFRAGWRLDRRAKRIESELIELAQGDTWNDRGQWASLIRQLASDSFRERQAAYRVLLESGQRLVPYLASLDEDRLTVEQRTRIRELKKRLSLRIPDTPERVACWLAEDREAWCALLDRDREATRILAAQRLDVMLDAPFDFDPQGSESQRRDQLARLRRSLGIGPPVLLGEMDSSTILR